MSDKKAVVKNADMSEDMQQDAIDCASQALEKYNIEKDIAAFIKKEFDRKYVRSFILIFIPPQIQPNMALCCWAQFRFICDSRIETFHLFLSRSSCNSFVQVGLSSN